MDGKYTRLLGSDGEIKAPQLGGTQPVRKTLLRIYKIPPSRLELGATYEVVGEGSIHDLDGDRKCRGGGKGLMGLRPSLAIFGLWFGSYALLVWLMLSDRH